MKLWRRRKPRISKKGPSPWLYHLAYLGYLIPALVIISLALLFFFTASEWEDQDTYALKWAMAHQVLFSGFFFVAVFTYSLGVTLVLLIKRRFELGLVIYPAILLVYALLYPLSFMDVSKGLQEFADEIVAYVIWLAYFVLQIRWWFFARRGKWSFPFKRQFPYYSLVIIFVLFCIGAWKAVISGPAFPWLPWAVKKPALLSMTSRSMPIIAAIKQFEDDKGTFPRSLEELVPDYLSRIPSTGIGAYPEFEYEFHDTRHESIVWYNLGSMKGRKVVSLWIYLDGDTDQSIAVFKIGDGRIINARCDRMVEVKEPKKFDAQLWRQNKYRFEMIGSLYKDTELHDGASEEDLIRLLGKPDGRRTIRDSSWELWVNCPVFMNDDWIFYRPTLTYPERMVHATLERVGDWMYVHKRW